MSASVEPVAAAKPRSTSWRRARSTLSPEQLSRQGSITHLAFSLLGDRDAAVVFLNTHHATLGARPLDLAGESAGGYAAVQREVQRLAVGTRENDA